MRPTAFTKIKWLRMINVKDCKKDKCKCGEKLRKLILTMPISNQHNRIIEQEIKNEEEIYKNCYNNIN